ncbi:ATP-binding protein [Pantoea sp. SS70]|uniref:ATP-binding protein n=1 Tax=Pantoea sp. SS70 TaxID=3024247 RepID=UPI002453099D|nr:ATP-binding protein [Pantoea sp. SS70]WGK60075.1 ATP-binding protein [Pantoea sp. SS70]
MRTLLLVLLLLAGLQLSYTTFATPITFTEDEKHWIAAQRDVPYHFIASWPLDYQEENQHIGLSRDYLKKISKITGLRFVLAEQIDQPAKLISAIAPELLTAEQREDWMFSDRWLAYSASVISHNKGETIHSLEQLRGKRVAVRSGTQYESWLKDNYPDILLLPVNHTCEIFQAVYEDRADLGLGSSLVMRPLLWRYYSHKLAIAGQIPELSASLTMGISAADPQLLSIINKALSAIPAADANEMFSRWVGDMRLGYPSMGVIFSLYHWEIFTFCFLVLLLGWLLQRAIMHRRRATASEERKTQFLAMMSHEIRTPMNAMIASLELMKRNENAHQQEQYLALASSSARSLLDLLNDILDHSKLSAECIVIDSQPFDLSELINTICASYRPMMAEKGLNLLIAIDEPVKKQWMKGDPHRLRQIINNLLSNAIKFTYHGAISLTLEAEFFADNTCMIALAVADTGIGIAPEAQKTLFDAWTQVDDGADRRYGGSGLGLWISQQLVTLMRGTLTCQSQPGEGSTFTLKVPLRLCTAKSPAHEPALPCFTPGTIILLVEDHPAAQLTLQAQLVTLGCQVELAENGQQALALLEEENYYDVILLDVNLPDISGYDIASRLRLLERERGNEATPVVAISAMNDDAHLEQCEASGFNAVLSKPIILTALACCLRRWCQLAAASCMHVQQEESDKQELQAWLETDVSGFNHACEAMDTRLMQHHVHRLRGTAQIFQMDSLAQLAGTIESQLRAGTTVSEELARQWCNSLRCEVTSAIRP